MMILRFAVVSGVIVVIIVVVIVVAASEQLAEDPFIPGAFGIFRIHFTTGYLAPAHYLLGLVAAVAVLDDIQVVVVSGVPGLNLFFGHVPHVQVFA